MFAGSVTYFKAVQPLNRFVPYESACTSWLGLSVECSKITVSRSTQPSNALFPMVCIERGITILVIPS